jgi:hypothetical protein
MELIETELELKIDIWGTEYNLIAVVSGNIEEWQLEQLWLDNDFDDRVNMYAMKDNYMFFADLEVEIDNKLESMK